MSDYAPPVEGVNTPPEDVERIYHRDLRGLNDDGSPCEVCGQHMHLHRWADMDPDGFVVDCSLRGGA